jgi:hypothetical protein
MKQKNLIVSIVLAVMLSIGLYVLNTKAAYAVTQKTGSVGLQGSVGAAPPSTAATITTPSNGQTVTNIPITVSGLCPGEVLVKIFKNGVFAGSAQCTNGSYSLQIDLFSGANELVAKITDALDQSGPDSNPVSVTFNDAKYGSAGKRVTLTSNYAKRGADPGTALTWPIILSGGTGPYAVSVDWGDNKPIDLVSREFAGTFDLSHTYASAGVYNIIVKATDKNGDSAFLQLVGIANGAISKITPGSSISDQVLATCKVIPWWLYILILVIIALLSFWLGNRFALQNLRRKLDRNDDII